MDSNALQAHLLHQLQHHLFGGMDLALDQNGRYLVRAKSLFVFIKDLTDLPLYAFTVFLVTHRIFEMEYPVMICSFRNV